MRAEKHVNGELTQGENIADIGGVKLAYAALQKALDKNPEDRNKKIDDLTPEQRFFLSFADIWRSKIREEDQKLRLTTDPHSPAQSRVNGPLSNMSVRNRSSRTSGLYVLPASLVKRFVTKPGCSRRSPVTVTPSK